MSGPSSPASTEDQRRLAGRYVLRQPVGRGGAGVVWKATDELLGRTVAVKECMLPPTVDDADRDKLLTRVMREARTAARLDHPALVTVFDVVQESGRPWIVMEYVESRSLSQVVRQDGPLPVAQVVGIGLTLLDALRVAHNAGVLHRDVKPANVLMTESGSVVLTDFGIAATTGDPTLTTSGMLLGSPSYMPPERARGEPATPDSDVWSLAATLYTLVEGATPYSGDHPLAVLSAVAEHRRRPMELAGPLEPLLADILDSEPDERPGELAVQRRLERIRSDLAAQGPTTTGGTPIRTPGSGGEKSPAERTAKLEARRPTRQERRRGRFVEPPVAAESVASESVAAEPVAEPAAAESMAAEPVPEPVAESPTEAPAEASAVDAEAPSDAADVEQPGSAERPRRSLFGRRRQAGGTAAAAAGAASGVESESESDLDDFFGPQRSTEDAAPEPATPEPAAAPAAPAAPAASPAVEPAPSAEPEPTAQPAAQAPPEAAEPAHTRRRRAPWLVGAGALVLVAVVVLALVLSAGGGSSPRAVPGVPAASPGTAGSGSGGASGSASPSTGASASSGTGGAVPAGWTQYHDPRYGWSIAVPPGFNRTADGTSRQVDFRDNQGRLLRVEINPKADPSALGDWQAYEPTFARQVSGYQRVRMEPIDGGDGSRAADWEFLFSSGKARLHVLNRGVVDGRTAHALYWQTPDSSWNASTQLRDQIFTTFQPPPQ